jgi:hypothetical protein
MQIVYFRNKQFPTLKILILPYTQYRSNPNIHGHVCGYDTETHADKDIYIDMDVDTDTDNDIGIDMEMQRF